MASPIKCIKGKILADLIFPNRWAETQKLVLVLQFPNCPCFREGSSPVCVSSAPRLSEQEVIGCGVTSQHHISLVSSTTDVDADTAFSNKSLKKAHGQNSVYLLPHSCFLCCYFCFWRLTVNTVTQRMRDKVLYRHLGAAPQWKRDPQEERNGSCKSSCPQYLPASLTVKTRFISLSSSNA